MFVETALAAAVFALIAWNLGNWAGGTAWALVASGVMRLLFVPPRDGSNLGSRQRSTGRMGFLKNRPAGDTVDLDESRPNRQAASVLSWEHCASFDRRKRVASSKFGRWRELLKGERDQDGSVNDEGA